MAAEQFLFVYGTLRHGANYPIFQWLESRLEWIGEATLPGTLYMVEDYPGYVRSTDPGELVRGDVYRLLDPEAVLARLDHYEQVTDDFPAPQAYVRELTEVRLADDRMQSTWIYRWNWPVDGLEKIESGDFLKR